MLYKKSFLTVKIELQLSICAEKATTKQKIKSFIFAEIWTDHFVIISSQKLDFQKLKR